jgi:cell division protein FtsB
MRFGNFKRFEFLVSLGCLVMLGYFGWQGFYGPRGFPYRDQLQKHSDVLTKELHDITTQRKTIETRVALMRPESIDPDLLDELARRDLNMVKQNDIIVQFTK